MTPAQRDEADRYFDTEISAALTPLVIDPAHPFPFLSNLSTSLAFLLHDPQRGTTSYARIKVPGVLKQWIPLESDVPCGHMVFVRLHEVIRGNAHKLYAVRELRGERRALYRNGGGRSANRGGENDAGDAPAHHSRESRQTYRDSRKPSAAAESMENPAAL